MRLKKYLFLLIFLFMAPGLRASAVLDSVLFQKIKHTAEAVGKREVPDPRTDVFKFEIRGEETPMVELETTLPSGAELLRAELKKNNLNVTVQVKTLPAAELGSKVYGVVRLSVSNNRKNPENAAEMVTQMILGTPVQILKKHHGYSLVRSPDRYISWVDNDAIAVMDTIEFNSWLKASKLVYLQDYGSSYSKPDVKSLRVSDLVKGDIVKLIGKERGFYKIGYPDGRVAYIPVKFAGDYRSWIARPNPDAIQILETAKTLIGTPYLWGGTSMKGVDCSGFTKTSYFLNGIILPRDASQQALVGEAVDICEGDTVSLSKCLKNLEPGDLLFFAGGKGRSSNPKITHTAIYMGNGLFIQSAGMVRINSMVPDAEGYSDFQSRTLVSARRMLNSIGKPQITRIDQHELYITKL